jgi:hypothetical protein
MLDHDFVAGLVQAHLVQGLEFVVEVLGGGLSEVFGVKVKGRVEGEKSKRRGTRHLTRESDTEWSVQ